MTDPPPPTGPPPSDQPPPPAWPPGGATMPGGAGRGAGRNAPGGPVPLPPRQPAAPVPPPGGAGRGAGRTGSGDLPPLPPRQPGGPPGAAWGQPAPAFRPGVVRAEQVPGAPLTREEADLAAERHRRYLPTATPPIFHMVATFLMWGVATTATFWALNAVSIGFDEGMDIADGEGHRFWIALGVNLLSYGVFLFWITRLGTNAGSYGLDLVLWTFAPWWFPLNYLGFFGAVLLIIVFIAILLWPFRVLMTKMCEAGGLPGWLAVCAWGPPLVPLFLIGAPEEYAAAVSVLALAALGFAMLIPIIVTVIETIGIYQDRADDRARLAAKVAAMGPTPG